MLRVALHAKEDDVETLLDLLLPILPAGVHHGDPDENGLVEITTYGINGHMPQVTDLEAVGTGLIVGEPTVEEVPVDWRERRRRFGQGHVVGGRVLIRSELDPPPPSNSDMIDVMIAKANGAFGSGAHPTTRAALELMLEIPAQGAFADLGCGTGTLSIAAAKLGWDPIVAIDYQEASVDATTVNSELNGVEVSTHHLDLTEAALPPVETVAANVPPVVHRRLAVDMPPTVRALIISGIVADAADDILALYTQIGFTLVKHAEQEEGWASVLFTRDSA